MVEKPGRSLRQPVPVEFAVKLTLAADPPFADDVERAQWAEAQRNHYLRSLLINKIGGTPYFIQNAEFPIQHNWQLLLQLDSADVPFYINFGDAGIGYAFISADGRFGKFLWQCF